ncbi:MAG: patatin-like phospholipase family protein [Hyphomonadaceae bacterium]|nr:patatin-like phospholipase family protein [Hyphomonadaceae bacterium]
MRASAWLNAALACLAAGCITIPRADSPSAASQAATPAGFSGPIRAYSMDRNFYREHSPERLCEELGAAGDGAIDILALSGGGAGGAFGAGVLTGLGEAGRRPTFEVVTGVSTGALTAPFAYLGPDWDDELRDAYTGGESARLMRSRGLGALFGTAFFQSDPLHDLVDRFVTDEMLAAVAGERAKGRMLLVATTNLDREETVIWDMGAIAAQGGLRGRRLFRDVLIASASVPGVFPPVMIEVEDGGQTFAEMHVDGGASTPFFIGPSIVLLLDEEHEALRGARIFVIANSQLASTASTTPFNAAAIAGRSFSSVLMHMTRTAIAQTEVFARRHAVDFRFTNIPTDFPYAGALKFDRAGMAALFEYGRRCAVAGRIWVNVDQGLARAALSEGRAESLDAPCPLIDDPASSAAPAPAG